MKLLIVVVEETEHIDDFVSAVVELDAAGVQIIDASVAMDVLAREAPIFAGLRELITRPKADSRIIFGVTKRDVLADLDRLLKRIKIDLGSPGVGYALQLPIEEHLGMLDFDE